MILSTYISEFDEYGMANWWPFAELYAPYILTIRLGVNFKIEKRKSQNKSKNAKLKNVKNNVKENWE